MKSKKTKKFELDLVIRENVLGGNRHLFPPETLKTFDGEKVAVQLNFENEKTIGTATLLYEEGKGCKARLAIDPDVNVEGLYPAMMGDVKERKPYPTKEEAFVITKCKPLVLGLCKDRNVDDQIKPIKFEE